MGHPMVAFRGVLLSDFVQTEVSNWLLSAAQNQPHTFSLQWAVGLSALAWVCKHGEK
jgi:hypothetical protein